MSRSLPLLGLGLALCALAQNPPPGQPPNAPLRLTLDDALARARANSPDLLRANLDALIAREDAVQAKAGLLPSVSGYSQYIYTQANGNPSGVFVSNDGVHVYNDQAVVHGDIYAPDKIAGYHRAQMAEALMHAKSEVAARGLTATVVAEFYGLASAVRKADNARQTLTEAQHFLDITQKQESGGEVAHADVVKAQIEVEQRRRETQEAQLEVDKARLEFSILLFPDFNENYELADDLEAAHSLPDFAAIQAMAAKNNPDIRAAQAALDMQNWDLKAARAERMPSLSFDYFFGLNANQVAAHTPDGFRNYGSAAQAQLTIPLWTNGALASRIRQAELGLREAKSDLSFAQRQLLADLNSDYREATTAAAQIASLRHSQDLAESSVKLTLEQYEAGECTALEVVDAQSTLAEARNAYDEGLVRSRVALANLQTLTGAF
ncbi:MAG TPA: TolC family protein [Bryobacteraceae bacterium]|nr:TolC family protein [Bryobacteraceae bacterium]